MKKKNKDPQKTKTAIMKAACLIFAKNNYTDASIRMIAREGGFPHASIRYYYPTKADLFDAVAEKICNELYIECEESVIEISSMDRLEGFSHYVKRMIDFSQKSPWIFRFFLLNISSETVGTIPGHARIIGMIESVRGMMVKVLKFKSSNEDFYRFSDSFNALTFYYLGTPESASWLLRFDPDSDDYYNWVHKTLVDIFLPTLKKLFQDS
ncbi:MAG: TetR/AcrR family transcriptional regulator [Deltaproteobacteria bacterium]|nr:TetR/AcrR family transcriptional regulator [Deltaproteobacteria bacterium]